MSKRKKNEKQRTRNRNTAQYKAVGQEAGEQTVQEAGEQTIQRDRKKELERLILAYTEELAEDINLRLLAQQEIGPAGFKNDRYNTGKVLYVEGIVVTDIRYPERKKVSTIKELGDNVKNIFRRR